MRKKIIIAGAVCCVLGIIGLTVALPIAVKDGIGIYNDLVAEPENLAVETVLEEPVTELKLILKGNNYNFSNTAEIMQSKDGKIHIWDTQGHKFNVVSEIKDGKAVVMLRPSPNDFMLTRENIKRNIAGAYDNRHSVEVAVPSTVKITSQSGDGLYFMADSSVNFVNADEIREYSYQPIASDTLAVQIQALQEENSRLKYQNEEKSQELEELNYLKEQAENQINNKELENNVIIYGTENILEEDENLNNINNWADIIREEEKRISDAKALYIAQQITVKQYWETADPAFQRLKTVRLREASLITKGKSKQEAVRKELSDLCDKQTILNQKEIEEITNSQLLSTNMISEEEYQSNMMPIAQDKIKLQTDIARLTASLKEMNYDFQK